MNNKGKIKTGGVILIMFFAVLLMAGLFFGVRYAVQNAVVGGGSNTGLGCQIAPSVNLLATNTLVTGTTPTVSANYSIYKGVYVGTIPSSLSKGASLDVLATATNYLNTEGKISSLECDGNDLQLKFVPYQIPTYSVYDDSFNKLTDIATVTSLVNVSASANQITAQIKISGVPDKSTGDMLLCIDYANKTEVTSSGIGLTGGARVDTPTWFTVAGTGSAVACFTIPAIVDGGSKTYDLILSPESGQTMGANAGTGVLTTIYTLNPVILDTQTGTFQTSKTWQDSLGADQTIASVDYDFYIDA
jgi:hypothetical protein